VAQWLFESDYNQSVMLHLGLFTFKKTATKKLVARTECSNGTEINSTVDCRNVEKNLPYHECFNKALCEKFCHLCHGFNRNWATLIFFFSPVNPAWLQIVIQPTECLRYGREFSTILYVLMHGVTRFKHCCKRKWVNAAPVQHPLRFFI